MRSLDNIYYNSKLASDENSLYIVLFNVHMCRHLLYKHLLMNVLVCGTHTFFSMGTYIVV